jgi:hypothetical protein
VDPVSKVTKKGWWSSSSRRMPAYQALGPEFKLQYCQKNKKRVEFFLETDLLVSRFALGPDWF